MSVAPIPRKVRSSARITFALRSGVSAVFLIAAVGKLLDLAAFQRSLGANEWLPTPLILPAAVLLILTELVAAVLLWPRRAGAALGAVLSLGFALYTGSKLLTGVSTECLCFGVFLSLSP